MSSKATRIQTLQLLQLYTIKLTLINNLAIKSILKSVEVNSKLAAPTPIEGKLVE